MYILYLAHTNTFEITKCNWYVVVKYLIVKTPQLETSQLDTQHNWVVIKIKFNIGKIAAFRWHYKFSPTVEYWKIPYYLSTNKKASRNRKLLDSNCTIPANEISWLLNSVLIKIKSIPWSISTIKEAIWMASNYCIDTSTDIQRLLWVILKPLAICWFHLLNYKLKTKVHVPSNTGK